MKTRLFTIFSAILIALLVVTGDTRPAVAQPQPGLIQSLGSVPDRAELSPALSSAPVMFIENAGQFGDGVRFQVRGGHSTIGLADDAIWVTVLEQPKTRGPEDKENVTLSPAHPVSPSPQRVVNIKLSFPGANPHPRIEPFNRLDIHVSDFIGNDPAKWHADEPVWGGVRYKDLYPGIDLEITGENGHLVQRLVAREGADLDAVRLRVEGAEGMALDGDLLRLRTAVGEYTLPLLQVNGTSSAKLPPPAIAGNQVTSPFGNPQGKARTVSPQSGASDLLYATFWGGSSSQGNGIAVDSSGAAYVTGEIGNDAFVVKLNAAGSGLVYATYLGGSGNDCGWGIGIDSSGAAYVTGLTGSSNFPTTPGAFDTSYNGGGYLGYDAFVVKLNAAGSGLVYGTYLGGSGNNDEGYGIAIDSSGAAYVTGAAGSSNFPTTPGAFDTSFNGVQDAFVVKLNAAGSGLVYATYLGSGKDGLGCGIAIDSSGAAYVTGEGGGYVSSGSYFADAFVVKLNAAGSGLVYSTFWGGSGDNEGENEGDGIAVDSSGAAYVTGVTSSSDFPTTPGAFDTSFNGGSRDAFVVKLNAAGSGLVYGTYLGGNGDDAGAGIAVDSSGAAYVTGYTVSSSFPTTPGAFDTSFNGGAYDAFVVELNAAGSGLVYSTFLGGSGTDDGTGIAVDSSGVAYVTGYTASSDFPTTPGAFDTSFNAGWDGFVVKLATELPWTLMFYLDGDNNLDATYPPIFNELESAADNPNVHVVALWDRLGNNNSAYYKIDRDPAKEIFLPQGELDMGESQTVVDFVNWARTNYPAQHYALILDDHGGGLGGAMWDETNNKDHLSVKDIGTALAAISNNGANKLDVLYMNSCLMAMIEDAYQVRNYVNYYVASENVQGVFSSPYSHYVSGVTATTTPDQVASLFADSFASAADDDYTISAADISQLNNLVSATNSLATLLNSRMVASAVNLTIVATDVQRFDNMKPRGINLRDTYVDLYDFARLVKLYFSDGDIQDAAQTVMLAVNDYIFAEHHQTRAGTAVRRSNGVSIFFPATSSSFYNSANYDFAAGATWNGPRGAPRNAQDVIAWGPMLVNYFQITQPGGPDDPNIPPLVSKQQGSSLFLPLIVR